MFINLFIIEKNKKRKKNYFNAVIIDIIAAIIVKITIIQPAIIVIMPGITGIIKTLLVIPNPTAKATKTPTSHSIALINFIFAIF